MKLKKIHAGSITERLLEQAAKNPNTLFKPNLGKTSRNISTVLSSTGINPTLRVLFFPILSDDKGVMLRPKITYEEVLNDRINTYDLDTLLFQSGANISIRSDEELVALGFASDPELDETEIDRI